MKRIIVLTFTLVCININLKAQGLLGLGTQKLSKKKIERLEIKLDQVDKISPSSVIDVEMIAYDKKDKAFKTRGLPDGSYSLNYNYKIEVENGNYDAEKQKIIIKKVNELVGDEVKIQVKLIDTEIAAEKTLKINYLGLSIADFSGTNGRNGTSGSTKYFSYDGSNGQNGGSNSESGLDGKQVTAFVKLEKVGNDEFIRLVVYYQDVPYYYSVNKLGGKILIDVSGGSGGNGGNGADGTAGNKEKFVDGGKGGDGGNGSNGGNGGSISIKFDDSMKGFENLISYNFGGGRAGYAGRAGTGGYGYKNGSDGRAGLSGLEGRGGQSPIITHGKVDFKWFN